ncbi:MAG: hypothetical protein ACK4VI_05700 [Alphaproteobacteria bacterium]
MATKKSKNLSVIFLTVLIAALAGFGFLFYQNLQSVAVDDERPQAPEAAIELTEEQLALIAHQDRIRQDFETSLNNFLQNVDTCVGEYQQKRRVVRDMIQPENMAQFEYVTENAQMAKALIAEMDRDMEGVLQQFATADTAIREFLERESPDDLEFFLNTWEKTKTEQLNLYVTFFDLEKSLLSRHNDVFDIFISSGGAYEVDMQVNVGYVAFEDESFNESYQKAIADIDALITAQRELLESFSPPSSPADQE